MMQHVTYKGLTFKPYIDRQTIQARVSDLAGRISEDFAGRPVLFICVLNGAFSFAADLFRAVDLHDAEITFIRLKSYEGTSTSGVVKEMIGLGEDIAGRDVIIVEDIIDTGITMDGLLKSLKARGANDIKVATLLFKPQSLKVDIKPDYVGFDIPSKFIIGYGLDLDGQARNLPDIWVIDNDNAD